MFPVVLSPHVRGLVPLPLDAAERTLFLSATERNLTAITLASSQMYGSCHRKMRKNSSVAKKSETATTGIPAMIIKT